MAKITIKLECENCLEEFQEEVCLDARNNFSVKNDVINDAVKVGWHVGARTLCPECRFNVFKKCKTCEKYENKSMCAPICKIHECIVLPDDFCADWVAKS